MADALADEGDPFSKYLDAPVASPASSPLPSDAPQQQPSQAEASPDGINGPDDPFAKFLEPTEESQTSDIAAFEHHAGAGVVPVVAGMAAAGAGAEVGGAIGAAVGAPFGGVGAVPGGLVGGFLGGIGGFIGGSWAAATAQDVTIHALPETWQETIGQSDRQKQIDEQYHPTASFLGGLAPYAVTMNPLAFGKAALAENATAFQRIMANPITQRVFGGTAMGGMELGQEVIHGEKPNWTNVAISTGFGMVFSRANRIGESLTELGARPVREALGTHSPAAASIADMAVAERPPTVAQAGDAKVMGPGITEDVFQGGHAQAPEAEMSAQETARTETSLIGPTPAAQDVATVARLSSPEAFKDYEALASQQAALLAHLEAITPPEGPAAPTPEMAAIQQHIDATDVAMRELAPEIGAAHRRAADAIGSEVVEPYDVSRLSGEEPEGGNLLEVPGGARQAGSEILPELPRGEHAEFSSEASAISGAESERQREELRRELPETRQTPEEPMQGVRQPSEPNAPSGLQPPAGDRVAMSRVPSSASQEAQSEAIAFAIAREMVAAGRPIEEAEALGKVEAARIVQRSKRMNGALGNPLALYNSYGAVIRRGGVTVPLRAPAAPEVTAEPAIDPAQARAVADETGTTRLIEQLVGRGATDAEIAATIGRKLSENQVKAFRSTITERKPPLLPSVEQPEIGRAPEIAAAAPPATPTSAPPQQGGTSEIESLDPRSIGVDAERFQFKAGGDEAGVTERLQGIEKWDPLLAGTAIVYRDAEGKNWIADGHQRLGLAKRLIEAGQNDIKLNAFVLNATDGITDADARATAAYKNIAEGTGTAIDAAKVLRIAKEKGIAPPPLPPRSVLVRDGTGLVNLSPEAFGAVVNEVVPEAQGAIVGRLIADPAQQVEAIRLLAALKPENVRQAEMVVRDMLQSGTEQMTQQSLFGDEHFAGSVVIERARIADEAIKQLRKDKATFNTLVKESERIVGAGENVLDQAANQGRLTTDEKASEFLTQLAFRAGPVSDALSDVARRFKAGDISRAEAARDFLGVVRRAVEEGDGTGQDVGGPVAGAAGGGEELATEPGAEGLPQTLIPGVEPVTDRQRAELEASKPMQGGDAAPGGMFDQDAQNQRELFQKGFAQTYGKNAQLAFDLTGDARNIVAEKLETTGQMEGRLRELERVNPFKQSGIEPDRPTTPANNPEIRSIYRAISGHNVQFPDEYQAELYSLGDALNKVDGKMVPGVEDEAKRLLGVIGPFLDPPAHNIAELVDAAREIAETEKADPKSGATLSVIDNELLPKWQDFIGRELRDRLGERVLYQGHDDHGEGERNLFVVHNIKPDGLLNAARMGGLPMPSLAIARTDRGGFEGFGDISLIGDRNLVDPTVDRAARVHNTDAYSPRYPNVSYEYDHRGLQDLASRANAIVKEMGDTRGVYSLDTSKFEDTGPREAIYSTPMKMLYLKEHGLLPEIVKDADGNPDYSANRANVDAAVREHAAAFEDWAPDQLQSMVKRERIFKGFTYSGNRRYVEHTLQNAYADMKANLKEGEAFNYGVGSIRSRWAKVFKSATGIEKARDNIVHPDEIEAVKKQFDDRFMALADEMRPYYKFDGGSFRYLDDTSQMMAEMATKGPGVLKEGFDNLPPEIVTKIKEFGADLASAPTAYFEAKLNRTVGLHEFRAALVPTGTRQSVLDALQKAGLETYQYDKSDPNSRIEALKQVQEDQEHERILFQPALMDAGIPGHQYIGHESQLTNYVIYDDTRASITNYEQGKNASVTFREGQRPLLRIFQSANASSGIHELGHIWVEDMLRDATHPAANDALRADAKIIRRQLGMTDDQAFPARKQHERFARWTEQYLREGVAPSPELASVFARFKGWLMQIYQSIKGLGTPINEDMRGVFDRMLAETPNRTVIAPEREGAQTLADLHEQEAAEAHPAEAEPIGDRIAAERDRYIAQQPPEVQNEIARAEEAHAVASAAAAQPDGEGGPGQDGRGSVGVGSGEPEPQSAGGSGGGERGEVVAGGAASMAEGNGVAGGKSADAGSSADSGLRQQRPEPAGNARPQPLAPDPATVFGPADSPYLDKAGNIRVENLTTSADVAQAIHDAADANNDFIGDRRGVVTDGQVMDLALAAGMEGAEKLVKSRVIGQAFNAEQVVMLRRLLIQSATSVSGLMKKAAIGSDADVLAYAQAKARHQLIQGSVAQATAEAGRALRAFRDISGDAAAQGVDQFLRTATGKTLFQLRTEAALGAKLDTPEAVSKFVNDAQKRGFANMLLEYWINGLISGPSTHVTYMIGNSLLTAMKAGPETAAAAMIGAARRAMGREGEVVHMAEVGAQFRALGQSMPMAGRAAADALRTGATTLLPGETARSLPFQPGTEHAPSANINEDYGYSDIGRDLFGAVRGLRDGIISTGKLVSGGGVEGSPLLGVRWSPLGAIPDFEVRGVNALPLGTLARLPSRNVAAIHSFFRTSNYSIAKMQLATRAAAEEGLTGVAFDARVAELRQNPTPEMMEQARTMATQLTLMGQGSDFIQKLAALTNTKILGLPLLKFVDPFVRIAGNIIDQSLIQRTPLGFMAPEIRADLMGKNGSIAQDTAIAKIMVGSGLMIAFGSLAAEGLMSGSQPDSPEQAAMWRLAGNQAHSIRIGNIWYDVHRLGPIGMLGSIAADMYDISHAAAQGDMSTAGAALLHAFTQTVLDQGFMSGPSQLIQALEDPARYGPAYVRNQLSSFVPYSVGMSQMARAMDPYSRQARTIVDAMRAKIPGMSETLLPRRDIWGQELPNLNAVGGRALTAIYMQPMSTDPVNLAMMNLGIYPAPVDRKIRNVALTDEQYDQYAKIAGRMAKTRLDAIVRSPDFRTWPPSTQHDVINEVITQSRETARGALMGMYPSIVSAATAARLAKFKQ